MKGFTFMMVSKTSRGETVESTECPTINGQPLYSVLQMIVLVAMVGLGWGQDIREAVGGRLLETYGNGMYRPLPLQRIRYSYRVPENYVELIEGRSGYRAYPYYARYGVVDRSAVLPAPAPAAGGGGRYYLRASPYSVLAYPPYYRSVVQQ
jgi:hypothetical protein